MKSREKNDWNFCCGSLHVISCTTLHFTEILKCYTRDYTSSGIVEFILLHKFVIPTISRYLSLRFKPNLFIILEVTNNTWEPASPTNITIGVGSNILLLHSLFAHKTTGGCCASSCSRVLWFLLQVLHQKRNLMWPGCAFKHIWYKFLVLDYFYPFIKLKQVWTLDN